MKKKCNKKAADACCCEDMEDLDAWELDEDILSELDLEEDGCCGECADCTACEAEEAAEAPVQE